MNAQEIKFDSTDGIIQELKNQYNQGGLLKVKSWVDATFQPNTKISVARDVTDLSKIDSRIIYDRVLIQLDDQGNETEVYFLTPINQDAFSSDLFLSVRLTFTREPCELLLYVK
jgi:hypothetical protein